MTSISESGEDVSEQYTDTEARLQTQRNKMERLQALLAQADAVEDLLAIETEIANTQYQIDSLTGALQGYDSRINYSAVTIDLAEESMTPSEGSRQRSLWERITDAVRDAFAGMVMFLEDMVVLLAIVLPYIALLAVLATIVAIIVKLVRRKQK
jgi:predicted  nucleic acid-binding Zn-ribbon protein